MTGPVKIETDPEGYPSALIPFDDFWDLVDFLSYHRREVLYQFTDDGFTITFPRAELDDVQSLLNDWTHSHCV